MADCIKLTPKGDIQIRLFLQPNSRQDQIVGVYGEELKITITASPIEGKANAHLLKFLSKAFKTAKSNILLEKGELSRHKQLLIQNPQKIPAEIQRLLNY